MSTGSNSRRGIDERVEAILVIAQVVTSRNGRLEGVAAAGARALRGRRGPLAGRPGRAPEATDADGECRWCGRVDRRDGGSRRPRVVRPRRRPLSRELGARAAGELGPADRRDQGAHPRGRLGRRGRRRALGAGRRRRRGGVADRPLCRGARFAVLGEWDDVRVHADYIRTHEAFPSEVGDALAFIAAEDVVGYVEAVEDVLESFEAETSISRTFPSPTPCSCSRRLPAAAGWRPSSTRRCCRDAADHPLRRWLTVLPFRGACRRPLRSWPLRVPAFRRPRRGAATRPAAGGRALRERASVPGRRLGLEPQQPAYRLVARNRHRLGPFRPTAPGRAATPKGVVTRPPRRGWRSSSGRESRSPASPGSARRRTPPSRLLPSPRP